MLRSIRLPNAKVFLKRLSSGSIVTGSESTTNAHGYFIIPKQAPDRYQLCVEADGFFDVCEHDPVTIVTGTFVLDHDVKISPNSAFLVGQVKLRDGQPCYRESQSFRTLVQAAISLVDGANAVVAGPVSANSMGRYVLPKVLVSGPYRLKAQCDTADSFTNITIGSRDLVGAAPFDLVIQNSPPKILTFIPTIGGRAVRKASPGATAAVSVAAEDPDGDALHYKWDDSSLGFTSADSAVMDWRLAPNSGVNQITVQVTDGKGGFATAHVSVRTREKEEAEFFSGIVTERFSGHPVGGATVSVNGQRITSDSSGFFQLEVPESDRYVLNARKPHYALVSQILYVGTTGLKLKLDNARRVPCVPENGCQAIVEKQTTSQVTIPPDSLVDSAGRAPGAGTPLFTDFHPYDLSQTNAIPGDYGAILQNGRSATMESFGAVDVEILDGSGNRYNLAPDKTAEIRIGVEPRELPNAPPVIPLFGYDENAGIWREEGQAHLVGNQYVGTVSHFTSWNADSVFNGTACIAVHVQNVDTTHLAPPFPFRLTGDIPTEPGEFRHPEFTVGSAPFALYRLRPGRDVVITLHTNSPPDFPVPPTFHVNSGAAIDPRYEASPYDGVPPQSELDTACHGSVNLTLTLPDHEVPWMYVPSTPCDIRTGCDAETTEYYKSVGALDRTTGLPTADRGTFSAWKRTNNFSQDPVLDAATMAAGEVEAIFYNDGDLSSGATCTARRLLPRWRVT